MLQHVVENTRRRSSSNKSVLCFPIALFPLFVIHCMSTLTRTILKRECTIPSYMEHDTTGDHVTADFQACIEDGTVSQIVRQRTLAATAALTLA